MLNLVNSMQFGLGKQVNSSNVARFEPFSQFGKHCGIISMDADEGGQVHIFVCNIRLARGGIGKLSQLAKNATKTYLATPEPQLQWKLQLQRELEKLPIPQTAPGSMLMLMLILDMRQCRQCCCCSASQPVRAIKSDSQ